MSYKPTAKQDEAWALLAGPAKHILLAGGSRSGKTFLQCRATAFRAIGAPKSRHAIFRYRFNACKASIVFDTFPKMMEICFPTVPYHIDRSDWFAAMPGGSEVWFGGLDDKERTEKILGQEYATLQFNECSQIPFNSINIAMTRLAQRVMYTVDGKERELRLKAFYDENPPSQAHWSYKQFVRHVEPDTGKQVPEATEYAMLYMNPSDNRENLPADYFTTLDRLPARMRERFRDGKFTDITAGALWTIETIDQARVREVPDMQRIVIAVDPSGAGDTDNADNDAIGICVAGLGMDGNAYVLEDLTCKAGPKTWGNVATTAFDRHAADLIVGEVNFGGAMVQYVIRTSRPNTPFKMLTASRGKAVRAEPISALTEQGKIRFAGSFHELEDELCSFTTAGFMGTNSPNRGDAFVWAMSELFPGIVADKAKRKPKTDNTIQPSGMARSDAWR